MKDRRAAALMLALWGAGGAGPPQPRHLIYLHGRIVQEQQSARPRSPRFGFYELEQIKEALRQRGFVVSAEIRPKSASESDAADHVVEQIRRLLGTGVPPDHVTVVGASMGGAIALPASARLSNSDLRFCVLGGCLSESVRGLKAEQGRIPSGHVLSIREASDDVTGPCPTWNDGLAAPPSLRAREIVLDTGRSHGFLYRPLPEWVDPVAKWAGGNEAGASARR